MERHLCPGGYRGRLCDRVLDTPQTSVDNPGVTIRRAIKPYIADREEVNYCARGHE